MKILLGCIVEGISTRQDGSFKMVLGTQEIDRSQVADLFDLRNKFCKILLSDKNISPVEEKLVDEEKIQGGKKAKTPSQRLRNVMFRVWEANGSPADFDKFYGMEMERLIGVYKDLLNEAQEV